MALFVLGAICAEAILHAGKLVEAMWMRNTVEIDHIFVKSAGCKKARQAIKAQGNIARFMCICANRDQFAAEFMVAL